MAGAAAKLRTQHGYTNMVDVPCWAHLLNRVADVVFDNMLLSELAEYFRLSRFVRCCELKFSFFRRLLFGRSPYWRTKWVQHQKEYIKEEEKKPNEQRSAVYVDQ